MSGNNPRISIIDPVWRQARRLACVKGFIAIGLCSLIVVLPVCFARSRSGVTTPVSHSESDQAQPPGSFDTGSELLLYGRAGTDKHVQGNLDSPANDPILQVWSRVPGFAPAERGYALAEPGALPDRSPDAVREAGLGTAAESFTSYPSLIPYTAFSAASEKRQLVKEIQRRLAMIRGGAATLEAEQPGQVSQQTQTASQTAATRLSLGMDANASLQLFQPPTSLQLASNAGLPMQSSTGIPPVAKPYAAPIAPPSESVASSVSQADAIRVSRGLLEGRVPESRPDPNAISNPQAQAAFDRHCQAAKVFQRQGQYVRAADAFTLALAYRPSDAGAYLGKGHALFAAGQYPGSAAALAKAVQLDPQRALKKVDLVAITGGPDPFIARFNDLARHAEADPTPEQSFLLAYVYYQMDQSEQAKLTIEAVGQGSLPPASVEALKAAINR